MFVDLLVLLLCSCHVTTFRKVVFPDVQDPLVLERALGLWGALEALKGDGEDVVAIVPRFCGQQLLAPLVDMGYR